MLHCLYFFVQAAAESLAYTDSGMQYPAEVGVNTYIKVQLSFLDKSVSSRDVFFYFRLTVNYVNSVFLACYL